MLTQGPAQELLTPNPPSLTFCYKNAGSLDVISSIFWFIKQSLFVWSLAIITAT